MPTSDLYNATSTLTLAGTAQVPVMSLYGATTKRVWLVGVRVKVGVTGALAGNQIYFALGRSSGSNTGTSPVAGTAHDYSAPASLGTWTSAWSVAPALSSTLAEWDLPQTTGSMWEEFPPTGDEWGVPAIASGSANAGVHLFCTASVGTSTPVKFDFIWSE